MTSSSMNETLVSAGVCESPKAIIIAVTERCGSPYYMLVVVHPTGRSMRVEWKEKFGTYFPILKYEVCDDALRLAFLAGVQR